MGHQHALHSGSKNLVDSSLFPTSKYCVKVTYISAFISIIRIPIVGMCYSVVLD